MTASGSPRTSPSPPSRPLGVAGRWSSFSARRPSAFAATSRASYSARGIRIVARRRSRSAIALDLRFLRRHERPVEDALDERRPRDVSPRLVDPTQQVFVEATSEIRLWHFHPRGRTAKYD